MMWVLCMRHINQNISMEVKSTQLMLQCLQKSFIIYNVSLSGYETQLINAGYFQSLSSIMLHRITYLQSSPISKPVKTDSANSGISFTTLFCYQEQIHYHVNKRKKWKNTVFQHYTVDCLPTGEH